MDFDTSAAIVFTLLQIFQPTQITLFADRSLEPLKASKNEIMSTS